MNVAPAKGTAVDNDLLCSFPAEGQGPSAAIPPRAAARRETRVGERFWNEIAVVSNNSDL